MFLSLSFCKLYSPNELLSLSIYSTIYIFKLKFNHLKMSGRRKKTRSTGVSKIVKERRQEIGITDSSSLNQPLIYPPLQVKCEYPNTTRQQNEIAKVSLQLFRRLHNSQYRRLFKQSNRHAVYNQEEDQATQFINDLVELRRSAFPEELHSRLPMKRKLSEAELPQEPVIPSVELETEVEVEKDKEPEQDVVEEAEYSDNEYEKLNPGSDDTDKESSQDEQEMAN